MPIGVLKGLLEDRSTVIIFIVIRAQNKFLVFR